MRACVDARPRAIAVYCVLPSPGTHRWTWLYLACYTLVIYGSCLASAHTNERFNRSLFTIQCVLNEQRDVLLTERDTTR